VIDASRQLFLPIDGTVLHELPSHPPQLLPMVLSPSAVVLPVAAPQFYSRPRPPRPRPSTRGESSTARNAAGGDSRKPGMDSRNCIPGPGIRCSPPCRELHAWSGELRQPSTPVRRRHPQLAVLAVAAHVPPQSSRRRRPASMSRNRGHPPQQSPPRRGFQAALHAGNYTPSLSSVFFSLVSLF
jgi:hypothetical protein